ncbi:recombinase family protein [Spongiibacter tropicus]|uniref:recombinase family protein n=1 Tax=Spongiibacter tropicus TaxID=454602 RepID=UPI0035BE47D0
MDRRGRSLEDLVTIIREHEDRSIGFQSRTESIDNTTAGGRLIFHILVHSRNLSET